MAEGTSLLRMHTAYTCIVGSNPTVSARTSKNGLPCGSPFLLVRTEPVGFEGLPAWRRATLSESPICWPLRGQRRAPRARENRRVNPVTQAIDSRFNKASHILHKHPTVADAKSPIPTYHDYSPGSAETRR